DPYSPASVILRPRPPSVALACGLSDTALIQLGADMAPWHVMLLDTPETEQNNRDFLAMFRPGVVLAVGKVPEGEAGIRHRFGLRVLVNEWQRFGFVYVWPSGDEILIGANGM